MTDNTKEEEGAEGFLTDQGQFEEGAEGFLTDQGQFEEVKVNTEENVVIKRGRGRPKKEKIEIPKEPKKRGPKPDFTKYKERISEITEPQKRGPKTCASKYKEYYAQYYRDHYSKIYLNCPNCFKLVQKNRICRHMRTNSCMEDQVSKKYFNQDTEKYIDSNKDRFNDWFKTQLNDSGALLAELLNKQLIDVNQNEE